MKHPFTALILVCCAIVLAKTYFLAMNALGGPQRTYLPIVAWCITTFFVGCVLTCWALFSRRAHQRALIDAATRKLTNNYAHADHDHNESVFE